MLSIGGLDPTQTGFHNMFQQADPFTNGLGVFDLMTWAWTPSYDASPRPYTMAPPVASWYQRPYGLPIHTQIGCNANKAGRNTLSSVKWSDPAVKGIFAPSVTEGADGSAPGPPNIGLIAGVSVAALIIGVILSAFAFCGFQRWRKKSLAHSHLEEGPAPLEKDSQARNELHAKALPYELPNTGVNELASPGHVHELQDKHYPYQLSDHRHDSADHGRPDVKPAESPESCISSLSGTTKGLSDSCGRPSSCTSCRVSMRTSVCPSCRASMRPLTCFSFEKELVDAGTQSES